MNESVKKTEIYWIKVYYKQFFHRISLKMIIFCKIKFKLIELYLSALSKPNKETCLFFPKIQ